MQPLLLWTQLVTSMSGFEHGIHTPQVELEWDGGAACPDELHPQERLARELARTEASPDERVLARVTVTDSGDGLQAELHLTTTAGDSRRVMQAGSCAEIEGAVALVVATTLDPLMDLRERSSSRVELSPMPRIEVPVREPTVEPESEPDEPEPEPEPADLGEIVAVDEPAADARTPVTVHATVASGVTGGLLPSAGPHLEVGLGVGMRRWRLTLLGHHAFVRRTSVRDVPDAFVVLQSWGVGAIGCGVPGTGRIEVPLCAGVEGGAIVGRGRGEGLSYAASGARPWMAAVARVGFHFSITSRLWLVVDAHGDAVALRPAFHVEGVGRVHLASRVAGRAVLGFGVRLP